MSTKTLNPLSGPTPDEVHLDAAPLVRALAQVRFPTILAINNAERVADFQEVIREDYPFLIKAEMQSMHFGPTGPTIHEELVWRFLDNEQEPAWRISLGTNYVSIEAFVYSSRADFISRFTAVLSAIKGAFKPSEMQRLGVRYVNRLEGEGYEAAHRLIDQSILGVANQSHGLGGAVIQALTEAQLSAEEGAILARWGSLQANSSFDPELLPPLPAASWVIDLDMFTLSSEKFDVDTISALATRFSARLYATFRLMITDDFLRFYGGAS